MRTDLRVSRPTNALARRAIALHGMHVGQQRALQVVVHPIEQRSVVVVVVVVVNDATTADAVLQT